MAISRDYILDRIAIFDDGCWIWLGCLVTGGYGAGWANGRLQVAHRISYLAFKGEIPEHMTLDHLCRKRCCVNPKHLEVVTRWENVRRGINHIARYANMKTCVRGHELRPATAPSAKPHHRICSTCARDRQRAWREKRKIKTRADGAWKEERF